MNSKEKPQTTRFPPDLGNRPICANGDVIYPAETWLKTGSKGNTLRLNFCRREAIFAQFGNPTWFFTCQGSAVQLIPGVVELPEQRKIIGHCGSFGAIEQI
ncbi:hypothetical protein [Chloroflexus sp.]|uniref:hypothetical protein n=1 Tax=Chloroflexus sp. TaxID=1904827 RepID=UPI004049108C